MENTIANSTNESLWLIGFSINPDTEYPDMYTLFFPDDIDEPLLSEGYIIFFPDPNLAGKALEQCDNAQRNFGSPAKEVDLVCDIAASLYLIENEDEDPSATIINFLNILFDLVKSIKTPIPEGYKQNLYGFADHLTFDRGISNFCVEKNISRLAIIEAIRWCVGTVVLKSKFVNW